MGGAGRVRRGRQASVPPAAAAWYAAATRGHPPCRRPIGMLSEQSQASTSSPSSPSTSRPKTSASLRRRWPAPLPASPPPPLLLPLLPLLLLPATTAVPSANRVATCGAASRSVMLRCALGRPAHAGAGSQSAAAIDQSRHRDKPRCAMQHCARQKRPRRTCDPARAGHGHGCIRQRHLQRITLLRVPEQELAALAAVAAAASEVVAPWLHDAQVHALEAAQRPRHCSHGDGALGRHQHHAHVV